MFFLYFFKIYKLNTKEEKAQGEYGLESLGKSTNDYFREQYKEKEGDREFIGTGNGVDYSENDGEVVGNFIIEKAVTLENTIYYRYAKSTLKKLNNDPIKLMKLYGLIDESQVLSAINRNNFRRFLGE